MWWLIALAAVLLIGFVPIGLWGIYDSNGARAWLVVGSIRFLIYPNQKNKKTLKKKKSSSGKKSSATTSHKSSGGNEREFIPIVKFLLEILRDLWKKLRVDLLELKIVLAQDDPSDLAINYGRTWSALGNLIPQLERYCNIKKRDVDVSCDFTAQQTQIFAQLHVSITVGRAVILLARHGLRILKNNLQFTNTRKGGAGS
ncbi:MAG: hypothetical protein J6Q92_08540 [Oscillospiraceae bacterium]|nr:hypothetical protein [Oscillospiraceae bacterium]